MSTAETQRVACSGCQTKFKLKTAAIGRKVKCPKCQTVFEAVAIDHPLGNFPASPSSPAPAQAIAGTPLAPQGTKRCDWCHEFIPLGEFDEHYKTHQGVADDGQYNAYPSLPPEERWKGDLRTVPQNYVHPECGSVTVMPEDIIRTYLVNPYFYGYSSFCCGCGTHISGKELKWVDTNESLYDYTRRLQANNPEAAKYRMGLIKTFVGLSVGAGLFLGLIVGLIAYFASGTTAALLGACAATVLGMIGCFVWLYQLRGGI